MTSENLGTPQVEVDNVFETACMENTTFGLATCASLFSETTSYYTMLSSQIKLLQLAMLFSFPILI